MDSRRSTARHRRPRPRGTASRRARPLVLLLTSLLCCAGPLAAQGESAGAVNGDGGLGDGGILTTLGELILDGGPLMIPIGIASVWMLGLALDRLWALRRRRIVPPDVWDGVRDHLQQGDVAAARQRVRGEEHPVTRMLHSGLIHWESRLENLSTALDEAGQREVDELQRHLPALQGIASVAPLLGLLGTVVGMIQSFFTVAKERALGNPALLAEGIGQALVTTAAGLSVAIPALVLFYTFRGRTRRLARELDDIARSVLALHRDRVVT